MQEDYWVALQKIRGKWGTVKGNRKLAQISNYLNPLQTAPVEEILSLLWFVQEEMEDFS